MKKISILILLVFFVSGCSIKYGKYSVISTKEIDFNKSYIKSDNKVSGTDVSKMYFLFPDKFRPMIDTALTNALQVNCADYLTDVEVTLNWWLIPYIYGETSFTVEGYPWYEKEKNNDPCNIKM